METQLRSVRVSMRAVAGIFETDSDVSLDQSRLFWRGGAIQPDGEVGAGACKQEVTDNSKVKSTNSVLKMLGRETLLRQSFDLRNMQALTAWSLRRSVLLPRVQPPATHEPLNHHLRLRR